MCCIEYAPAIGGRVACSVAVHELLVAQGARVAPFEKPPGLAKVQGTVRACMMSPFP